MKNVIIQRALEGKFVLIAEIGVNYYDIAKKRNSSPMDAAKLMIREAKQAGIHAVKFQTYTAGTLAVKQSPYYWDIAEEPAKSQYELFKKYDSFGKDEYQELSDYCDQIGIEFYSTAFDFESADYLCDMMNVYKVSSSDLNNLPFVEYLAKKNKPILLSAGASDSEEIDAALEAIRRYNDKPLILQHCVLEYPTPYEHANLNKIVSLRNKYPNTIIGYSDHTKTDVCHDVIKTAYLLGATVVEKHFTLDKSIKGNDHYHAMDPDDARSIIHEINFIDRIRGTFELRPLTSEQPARQNARRSVVSAQNIPTGTIITRDMLTFKRPGTGISPSQVQSVIGKAAQKDIAADTILQPNMIS